MLGIDVELGVPVFGVPVPGKNVAHLIVCSGSRLAVNIAEATQTTEASVRISYPALEPTVIEVVEKALTRFVNYIYDVAEAPFKVLVEAYVKGNATPLMILSSVSAVVVTYLEKLWGEPLTLDEVLLACRALDEELEVCRSLSNAYRAFTLKRAPLVYREGEGAIILETPPHELKVSFRYLRGASVAYDLESNPLADHLTYLISRIPVEAALNIACGERLRRLFMTEVFIQRCILRASTHSVDSKLFHDLNGALEVSLT